MKNTVEIIEKEKIIVIVRGVERSKLIPLGEALYNGGVRVMECTFDASGKTPDTQIADNIKMLVEHFGDKMAIGAGTVLTKKQVKLTKKAGGKFIISPDANEQIIKATKKCGLVSIPGVFTATEAVKAYNLGADFVKLFPSGMLGAKYLKELKAPLSHIKFLAVGGVDTDNMHEYNAYASGYGIASGILNKKFIEEGNFEKIEELAKKYTDCLASL